MNKQEVIDEIKRIHANAVGRSFVSPHPLYADGVADTCSDVIELLNQFDEPQKVAVPLNESQQIVLEWLQSYADKDSGDKPIQTIFFMWDCIRNNSIGTEVLTAIRKLSRDEQFQVLAAFAELGMSEVAE